VFETEDTDEEAVIKACMELPEVKKHTEGKEIIKKIYVKNRIVNLVVKG
jgi:leucyl-tRNA synthetase